MDKEKEIQETPEDEDVELEITSLISDLRGLVNDWENINTYAISRQAEHLIIEKARELVKLVDETKPVKSEMPCNCKHEDTAREKAIDELLM